MSLQFQRARDLVEEMVLQGHALVYENHRPKLAWQFEDALDMLVEAAREAGERGERRTTVRSVGRW